MKKFLGVFIALICSVILFAKGSEFSYQGAKPGYTVISASAVLEKIMQESPLKNKISVNDIESVDKISEKIESAKNNSVKTVSEVTALLKNALIDKYGKEYKLIVNENVECSGDGSCFVPRAYYCAAKTCDIYSVEYGRNRPREKKLSAVGARPVIFYTSQTVTGIDIYRTKCYKYKLFGNENMGSFDKKCNHIDFAGDCKNIAGKYGYKCYTFVRNFNYKIVF